MHICERLVIDFALSTRASIDICSAEESVWDITSDMKVRSEAESTLGTTSVERLGDLS